VDVRTVRKKALQCGLDMQCCRTVSPVRDLHSLPFHYSSSAMRTELWDQQYLNVRALQLNVTCHLLDLSNDALTGPRFNVFGKHPVSG